VTLNAPLLQYTLLVLFCMSFAARNASAGVFDKLFGDEQPIEVRVVDPYIELHTGAGEGYPIFHVEEKDAWIEILKRKTDWFKVRTETGKEGWVAREQLTRTLTPANEYTEIADTSKTEFTFHRWELGAMGGDFEGGEVITIYGGFFFMPNLSAEISASKLFFSNSDADMADASLLIHPFPSWRLSPFFTVGTGVIKNDPNSTLVQEDDRTDQLAHVGAGLRVYLARRFIFRAQYKHYVIFESTDDRPGRDNNQEIDEWKAGFAFFF